MAAFRSVSRANAIAATSVAPTKPTGLTAGDLMIAFCEQGRSNVDEWSTPSGWTRMGHVASIIGDFTLLAKIADSSDASAGSFTFSITGTISRMSAILYAVSGTFASTGNIAAKSIAIGSDSSGTETVSTGVTPLVASSLMIMYFFIAASSPGGNSAYALQTDDPGGWTEDTDSSNGSGAAEEVSAAHATRTAITATGSFSCTTASTSINGVIGALLSISDTVNGSVTTDVISLTSTTITPGAGGGVTTDAIALTAAPHDAVASAAAPKWQNTQKSSAASISNTQKS